MIINEAVSRSVEDEYECFSLNDITIPSSVSSIGDAAFGDCGLTGVYFQGNAPTLGGSSVFCDDFHTTVYYLPGTTGWEETYVGCPTVLWVLPSPVILSSGPSFGVQTNAFGFVISWATNAFVVVDACTNLTNPIWLPVSTNTLTGGSSYFRDALWTNYPSRFYRLRSP